MGAVTTLPWSGPITRAHLEAMPDDGHRYELLDGALLVSPSPSRLHQRAVALLWQTLEAARPRALEVLIAPFDVVLADDTVLQPDVLVARRIDVTDRDLPAAPVLAVEVLSPSTRRIDELLKHARYAAAGVAHYWLIDPLEPSLTAYELGPGGTYAETGLTRGSDPYVTSAPFAVSIMPSDLVADR